MWYARRRLSAPTTGANYRRRCAKRPKNSSTAKSCNLVCEMESLNSSLAYPLSQIDPHVDSKKNDALRFTQLKPLLRLFAKSVNNLELVDPASDNSFGALLSSQPRAELGRPIVEDVFGKAEKCRICLISPICTILSP